MLSIPHLIIIFVVALIVFGPEKLPELARNLGKVMAEFRRATGDLRSTFEDHLRDLEREADEHRISSSSQTRAMTGAPTATGQQPQSTPPQLGSVPSASPTLRPKPDMPGSSAERADSDGQSETAEKKSEQESETITDGHEPA
jgi:TatA/E family protein of Tat protein translocase